MPRSKADTPARALISNVPQRLRAGRNREYHPKEEMRRLADALFDAAAVVREQDADLALKYYKEARQLCVLAYRVREKKLGQDIQKQLSSMSGGVVAAIQERTRTYKMGQPAPPQVPRNVTPKEGKEDGERDAS